MAKFFNKIPKIGYNFIRSFGATPEYVTVTNVLFRVGVVRSVMSGGGSYYEYIIKEGETPELLADKIYGDPEAHWFIIYANDILDPQFDWPLDPRAFYNHITDKYGSIEAAQTTYHHWEKVTSRYDSRSRQTTVTRQWIDEAALNFDDYAFTDGTGFVDNTIFDDDLDQLVLDTESVPYDTYNTLAGEVVEAYNLPDGSTCTETITRNRVTVYDYENELNENRRTIRLIRPEFWPLARAEFDALTTDSSNFLQRNRGLRTLR